MVGEPRQVEGSLGQRIEPPLEPLSTCPFAERICSVFEANRHHQLQNLKNFYHMTSLNSSEDVGCEPPFGRSQRESSKMLTDPSR